MKVSRLPVLGLILAVAVSGCGQSARGPYASNGEQVRDIGKAEALYQRAVAVIGEKPDEAEQLLREALGFDLYHGAAHNNLGALLLKKDHLYDAAEEFEWARKLLPGLPEPRFNLSLVLDRAGKSEDARDAAKAALEVSPGHVPAMMELTRLDIRSGTADAATIGYLDTIVMRTDNAAWRQWAEEQRVALKTKLQP